MSGMSKEHAIEVAMEIGAAIREDRGGTGHPPEVLRWAESFTWWRDVVAALGAFDAMAALLAGHEVTP
jgi:hypothetical protein